MLGHDLRELNERQIAHWRNEHVGFVFQQFNLIPVLTALENVELPLKLTNLKKAERLEHAATALKLVGLGDRLHHFPRQLSGGQEQRVAIARAIVTDPALILADEPTGNLDAASAQEVLTLLSKLNRDFGKTVVMVTHDPHAAQFASKIHHLEKGELLEQGRSGLKPPWGETGDMQTDETFPVRIHRDGGTGERSGCSGLPEAHSQPKQNQRPATVVCSARKDSVSARVGMEDCAPGRVTEMAAAAQANRSPASMPRPSASATARAALKTSPAAVASRASTANAGTWIRSRPSA